MAGARAARALSVSGASRSAAWVLAVLVAACSGKVQPKNSAQDTENLLSAASAYTAAAEKTATTQALEEQWARLAAALPMRIEQQQKRSQGQRQAAAAAVSWSKARAAFAAGNLREAVSAARTASDELNSP